MCQALKEEYGAWARRRLDPPAPPAEPVLATWGMITGGKPAFIGLAPGSGESADAWHDFLQDLKDRGLPSPLLVISDGGTGPDRRDRAGLPQRHCVNGVLFTDPGTSWRRSRRGRRPRSRTPTGPSSAPKGSRPG